MNTNNETDIAGSDVEAVKKLGEAREQILTELRKTIVGMEEVIDEALIAIFAKGHVLLEGVPGLAKTLLVSSISKCLSLTFHRIQFTPDLMPSDITGTEILQDNPETGKRVFTFAKGPIFSNILLADEINRTPPKTQAALLEAMQEKMVTAGGEDYALDPPFFVLATQNPLEQEGTYTLPEAQLDRFMFKVHVSYPSFEEEVGRCSVRKRSSICRTWCRVFRSPSTCSITPHGWCVQHAQRTTWHRITSRTGSRGVPDRVRV
jgi:MoxR-like ATPase